MIEIIKPGKKPEPEITPVMTFICPKCDCEFRTDEYLWCAERTPNGTVRSNGRRWFECTCPEENCRNMFSATDFRREF